MDKRITRRANALICLVIVLGFALTSFVSCHSNREEFEHDAEQVSMLTSKSIARDIDAQFTQPIDVSLAMANDSLLKGVLAEETERLDDAAYAESLTAYLDAYREKYRFDSVFLASAATKRYYHYNGINRTLEPENPENGWYYDFLESDGEYALNIDNDEATNDEITVFVNCRILDDEGETLGIVGAGFRIDDLRALFSAYEQQTGTDAYLVDADGTIEVSTDGRDDGLTNLFSSSELSEFKDRALAVDDSMRSMWYDASEHGAGYLIAQYVPYLDWHLVVDHDTSELNAQIARQLAAAMLAIAVVIVLVLLATTSIFRRCNRLIVEHTTAAEQKRKTVYQEAAEQLYDNIYDVDITHNRTASAATDRYFESLGAPIGVSYDQALSIIAVKQVAEGYRQGYLDAFGSEAVLEAHRRGVENITYEFKMSEDGVSYHWMRIYAHLFVWEEDDSVRMLVYRKNIDDEKRREHVLFEQMQRDSLTGLLNKAATQRHISDLLAGAPDTSFAFFILDIDDFKGVNDRRGHSAGDEVLVKFAEAVRAQFRPFDVVGRIGGDEFVAFVPLSGTAEAKKKAADLVSELHMTVRTEAGTCELSTSVGIAFDLGANTDFETLYRNADQALYQAKAAGKNRYALYGA